MDAILVSHKKTVGWLPAESPTLRKEVYAPKILTGNIRVQNKNFPVLHSSQWCWIGKPLDITNVTFFIVCRFRALDTILLTMRTGNSEIILAVDVIDGYVRHLIRGESGNRLAANEINGCRVNTNDTSAFVYGFQYVRKSKDSMQFVACTPQGILQECSYTNLLFPPSITKIQIGPSDDNLLLHELRVYPYTSLSNQQLIDVHSELRRCWY